MVEQELKSARWYEEALKEREQQARVKRPKTFGEKLNLVVALTLLPVSGFLAWNWYEGNGEQLQNGSGKPEQSTYAGLMAGFFPTQQAPPQQAPPQQAPSVSEPAISDSTTNAASLAQDTDAEIVAVPSPQISH